jgi:SAM-dependent methyltransferase
MAAEQMMAEGTTLYGVDIAQHILDACTEALAPRSGEFVPVLVPIDDPESCLDVIEPCDLFVCLTVYQHLPDKEYAERITQLAARLLVPGGLAIVQTREPRAPLKKIEPRPYKRSWMSKTLLTAEEFEAMAQAAGFKILSTQAGASWSKDYRYHYCQRVA